eukprot:336494_1
MKHVSKKGKSIKLDDDFDDNDLKEFLHKISRESVKEMKKKLVALNEKSKSIRSKETEDIDSNMNKMDNVGYKSLKEIKKQLVALNEKSKRICSKETKERDIIINKIKEYKKINNEIEKCVTIENSLMLLK